MCTLLTLCGASHHNVFGESYVDSSREFRAQQQVWTIEGELRMALEVNFLCSWLLARFSCRLLPLQPLRGASLRKKRLNRSRIH
jgi:hypothetical protein